jgi:hypothetical protein
LEREPNLITRYSADLRTMRLTLESHNALPSQTTTVTVNAEYVPKLAAQLRIQLSIGVALEMQLIRYYAKAQTMWRSW